jgi:hypothetical protein
LAEQKLEREGLGIRRLGHRSSPCLGSANSHQGFL